MARKEPSKAQLVELFSQYSSSELVQVQRNDAAFANNVYNLEDNAGNRYVMRVLRLQLPETVSMEADLQDRLKAAGINTPHYMKIANGRYVGKHNSLRFTLSKFIEGQTPKSATLAMIEEFGAITARMHNAWEGAVIPRSKMQWLNPENAASDLASYTGPYRARLDGLIGIKNKLFSLGLPKAVIHGDLWLGNVFVDGNKVTAVFDLETAQNTIRVLDLGRTYASMRLETDFPSGEIIDRLFRGYNSTASKPITEMEKGNFGIVIAYVAGVCAAWHAAQDTEYTESYLGFGEEISLKKLRLGNP